MIAATMLIPNIRAVLFDAVGTLIQPWPAVAAAYGQVGRMFGSRLSDEEIDVRFKQAWAMEEARDTELDQRTSEERERERWRKIVESVFHDVADLRGLFASLWEYFAAAEHWAMYPDVAPAWRRLRQAGLRLGIASNFDLRLHELCRRLPPLDAADPVVVSSLLGRRKPHAEFFAQAAARIELPPEQILFVGDSLEHDYRPALAAGMSAVLLKRDESADDEGGCRIAAELGQVADCLLVTLPAPAETPA